MKTDFIKTLSGYQFAVNKEIESFFSAEIKKSKSPYFTETLKMLQEFSLRGGKRIRAILIICGYLLAGGKDKKNILKTSVFIELIHNFLLIHDDIMDKGELRRDKPTLHCEYQNLSKSKKEEPHYGISMAIVGGDLMEFLARKILDQSKFPADKKNRAIEKLNFVLEQTAYGQMLEFYLRDNFKAGGKIMEQEILNIYKTKTALYTFAGPLQIGAILAGANQKLLNSLEKIGMPLGVAFQIKDDLEDMESDLEDGQPSLLNLKNPNECRQMAKNLISETKTNIAKSNYPTKEKEFLMGLADYILNRT